MITVPVGEPLIEVMTVAFHANQSVLLEGPHGIGKSESCIEVAHRLGVEPRVIDLSVMEPPDLIGLPTVAQGRTRYNPPSLLPLDAEGLLIFEELNRCPRYMRAPCLQLLTARRLNDYALPEGWRLCAAINDRSDGDDYDVDVLDPALLSRFLRVKVRADLSQWLAWARDKVHPKVLAFAEATPQLFDDRSSNPRAWTRASAFLRTWEGRTGSTDALTTGLLGWLGEPWAVAFLQFLNGTREPLHPTEILASYPVHRSKLQRWIAEGHLDVAATTLARLQRHLQPQRRYDAVVQDEAQVAHVQAFLGDLPGDLRLQADAWFDERGFHALMTTPVSRTNGARV